MGKLGQIGVWWKGDGINWSLMGKRWGRWDKSGFGGKGDGVDGEWLTNRTRLDSLAFAGPAPASC